jgi:Uma2 family endonuclease
MSRAEFHHAYERAPKHFKAELIGGIVYVASPLRRPHGTHHLDLGTLLGFYKGHTTGVEAGDNATVFLADNSEPQPDLYLRILPEFGGQSGTSKDEYVTGAPELIIEVAHASHSLDLHGKREDYAANGVREYLVATLADQRLRWFDLANDRELAADSDGVVRVRQFPGLWIDPVALFAANFPKLMGTLQQGIDSAEHAAFIDRLAKAKKVL